MRLLTLDRLPGAVVEAECGPSKLAPWGFAVGVTVVGAVVAAMGAGVAPRPDLPAVGFYAIAVFFGMVALIGWVGVIVVMRSDDYWLMRISGERLWIRCAPLEGALIVELERGDVAWARACRIGSSFRVVWRGGVRSETAHERFSYLDLGLSAEAAAVLERFLGDEKIAKQVREQVSASVEVYTKPVRMIRPGVLRLCWRGMSPRLGGVGRVLSAFTEVRPGVWETRGAG